MGHNPDMDALSPDIATVQLVANPGAEIEVDDLTQRLAETGWRGEVLFDTDRIEIVANRYAASLSSVCDSLAEAQVLSASLRWRDKSYELIGGQLMER